MDYADLVAALFHGRPGEPFECHGFDTDEVTDPPAITWHGEDPMPTLAECEAWLPAAVLVDVRAQRDRLLSGCDWTQVADSPLADAAKATWSVYRQALRDLPGSSGFDPLDPVWPEVPS